MVKGKWVIKKLVFVKGVPVYKYLRPATEEEIRQHNYVNNND